MNILWFYFKGSLWPSLIVERELESRMYPYSDHIMRLLEESGYLHIQATKPDTVGKKNYFFFVLHIFCIVGKKFSS